MTHSRSGRVPFLRQVLPIAILGSILGLAGWITTRARIEPADLTFINGTEIQSLDPATVTGVPEGRILRCIFEGLTFKHPNTLDPMPGMAESWEISEDGLTYTFKMREGARWTNGDQVTAHDFVYSWERFLHPLTGAEYAYQLWYVTGARAYSTQVDENGEPVNDFSSVGIRAEDAETLVVELDEPTPFFLQLTAFYPMFPVNRRNIDEMKADYGDGWQIHWLKPENLVTNGAFRVVERRIKDRIRLAKNEDYWDADSIALNSIDALAVDQYMTNLNLYLQGDADWINYIPNQLISRLLEREDFTPTPYFGTYFYRVNVDRPPFDDVRVRQALALTIDRKAICENITKSGQRTWGGLVPFGMGAAYTPGSMESAALKAEDYESGFDTDIRRAKGLLAEAGYGPNGAELPTIEILYNTSETHRDIAEVIGDAWKRHLGVRVRLLNQEWKVYLDSQTQQSYDVSRSNWIGDYLDPNTFLDMFVTGGENNKTGWGDPRYDALIEAAKSETDADARFALLGEAEQLLMTELPILPIYSYSTQNIVNPRFGGFGENLLDEQFPRWWYWRSDDEVAAWRGNFAAEREAAGLPVKTEVELHGPPEGMYPPNAPGGVFPVGDPRRELSPLSSE